MKTLFWIRYTPKGNLHLKSETIADTFRQQIMMVYNKPIPHAISIVSEFSVKGVFHYHILLFAQISDQGLRTKIKKSLPDFNKAGCYIKVKDDTQETIDYLHTYMLKGDAHHDYWSEWNDPMYAIQDLDHYVAKWVNTTSKTGKATQNQQKQAKFHFFLTLALEKIEKHVQKHYIKKIDQTSMTNIEIYFKHNDYRNLWKLIYNSILRFNISKEILWSKPAVSNITLSVHLYIIDKHGHLNDVLDEMADIEYDKLFEKPIIDKN